MIALPYCCVVFIPQWRRKSVEFQTSITFRKLDESIKSQNLAEGMCNFKDIQAHCSNFPLDEAFFKVTTMRMLMHDAVYLSSVSH